MSDALADTCQRTLDSMGVRQRLGRVTQVQEGRQSNNPHVGKQVTIEDTRSGEAATEVTDLVLWTAGARGVMPLGSSARCFQNDQFCVDRFKSCFIGIAC